MPHAAETRMPSNVVSYWPPWTVEEDDKRSLFFIVQGVLGLALVAKTCPHRPQALKKVNNGHRRFRRNIYIYFCSHFFFDPSRCPPRHAYKRFRAYIRRSGCVGAISKPHLSPTFDPILKLCTHKATAWYANYTFSHEGPMFVPLFRDRFSIFARVLCEPLLTRWRRVCVCVCFFFSPETWDSLRPKYPPKKVCFFFAGNLGFLKTQIFKKKKKNPNIWPKKQKTK